MRTTAAVVECDRMRLKGAETTRQDQDIGGDRQRRKRCRHDPKLAGIRAAAGMPSREQQMAAGRIDDYRSISAIRRVCGAARIERSDDVVIGEVDDVDANIGRMVAIDLARDDRRWAEKAEDGR